MKKTDINKDIIKRDGAERRKEDIAAHGRPTAFRKLFKKPVFGFRMDVNTRPVTRMGRIEGR